MPQRRLFRMFSMKASRERVKFVFTSVSYFGVKIG
jgi:hypothetical protein